MTSGLAARPAIAGFSLVELMVVVTIIAFLSVTATMGLSRGRGVAREPASAAADALRSTIAGAREAALLSRRASGLWLYPDGWETAQRDPATRLWSEAGTGQRLRPAVDALNWQVDNWTPSAEPGKGTAPDVVFLTDGRMTPLRLHILAGGVRLLCAGDGRGDVGCRSE